MLVTLISFVCLIIPLLISVAYFTLYERHVLAALQRRQGPNIVGFYGLLQPLADGLKLLIKESILPKSANTFIFIFSPIFTFGLAMAGWIIIPVEDGQVICDFRLGLLYVFALSSLGVHTVIMAGWSSNSKYAFLGGLRSAAQMISYEVSLGVILVSLLIVGGTLNFSDLVQSQQRIWLITPLFPIFIFFFICALAETNRHPFDLPEAEAELVSGYNVEYSAMGFALFFLAEYSNIILMSAITGILFLGGWLPFINLNLNDYAPFRHLNVNGFWPFIDLNDYVFFRNLKDYVPFRNLNVYVPGCVIFALKTMVFITLFVLVRGAFPRYRYDQLMRLGWKVFLPFSLAFVILFASLMVSLNLCVELVR